MGILICIDCKEGVERAYARGECTDEPYCPAFAGMSRMKRKVLVLLYRELAGVPSVDPWDIVGGDFVARDMVQLSFSME